MDRFKKPQSGAIAGDSIREYVKERSVGKMSPLCLDGVATTVLRSSSAVP